MGLLFVDEFFVDDFAVFDGVDGDSDIWMRLLAGLKVGVEVEGDGEFVGGDEGATALQELTVWFSAHHWAFLRTPSRPRVSRGIAGMPFMAGRSKASTETMLLA